MPASVVSVHVENGDRVEKGQPLVTLTAMKMEIVCDVPANAVVERVSCEVGALVTADQVLVTLRIDSTEAPDGAGETG
jgi:biotin carboxyl carrier protein